MQSYSLEKITERTLKSAVEFVEGSEANSIALMSRLLDGSWNNSIFDYFCVYEKKFVGKSFAGKKIIGENFGEKIAGKIGAKKIGERTAEKIAEKQIVAVVMKSSGGLIQHCIKNLDELKDNPHFASALKPLFAKTPLYCIMGEKNSTLFLASLAEKYSRQKMLLERRDYLLLLYNPANLPGGFLNEGSGYNCLRCGIEDVEALFALQKEYDIVEVLPKGRKFDGEFCRKNLMAILGGQIVYGIKNGGRFVAKAGTNALGKNYCQIGGVFTDEEFRCRGMARSLMTKLVSEIVSLGKKPALFVRVENAAAKKAYRKSGFVYENDYLILYYRDKV